MLTATKYFNGFVERHLACRLDARTPSAALAARPVLFELISRGYAAESAAAEVRVSRAHLPYSPCLVYCRGPLLLPQAYAGEDYGVGEVDFNPQLANAVSLVGRLGQPLEVRPAGRSQVANCSLAVSTGRDRPASL